MIWILIRFKYWQLYFHNNKFSRKICKNIVPRKFWTIRYMMFYGKLTTDKDQVVNNPWIMLHEQKKWLLGVEVLVLERVWWNDHIEAVQQYTQNWVCVESHIWHEVTNLKSWHMCYSTQTLVIILPKRNGLWNALSEVKYCTNLWWGKHWQTGFIQKFDRKILMIVS